MDFSTSITVGGQPAISNVPHKSQAWGKANSVYVPAGRAHSEAWFVMTKGAIDELDDDAAMDIVWKQNDTTLTFKNFYLIQGERLLQGGRNDPSSLYLVQLVDARYLVAVNSGTGLQRVNLRSYANAATYLTGTSGWTWTSELTDLWDRLGILGAFPGLPALFTFDEQPENFNVSGINCWHTLCSILDAWDCAIVHNPFTGVYSIVQLGDLQPELGIDTNRTRLKWDGQPVQNNADVPATVYVYFAKYLKAYGQERHTEVANNWAYTGAVHLETLATGVAGAIGSRPIWTDLPQVIDEDGNVTNAAAVTARATRLRDSLVARLMVQPVHRVYSGLLDTYTPGGEIRAVLWRSTDDGNGTQTEVLAGAELYTERTPDNGLAWSNHAISPDREHLATLDLSRRSYPNYPRTVNVVQVTASDGSVGTYGEVVAPNSAGFHYGVVRRWVNNTMQIMERCWIRFVDDHDNLDGQVNAEMGQFYGPAMLSGVSTVGELLPVYLIRNYDADELVFFELYQAKEIPKNPGDNWFLAKILSFNGTIWSATATIIKVWDDYWFDFAKTQYGFFTGVNELDRGWAKFRKARAAPADPDEYELVWMSGPAHVVAFELTADRDPSAPPEAVAADINNYYLYGNDGLQVIDVWFREAEFPFAKSGSIGRGLYDDVNRRYEAVLADQLCLTADALLDNDMCGEVGAAVSEFNNDSPHPFSMIPPDAVQGGFGVLNIFGHRGFAGMHVQLVFWQELEEYVIIDVEKSIMFLAGPLMDDGSGPLWQYVYEVAGEICEDPDIHYVDTTDC